MRYNCIQPYNALVHVGDSVTWTNNSTGELRISHASNYAQMQCGGTDGLIQLSLAPAQSSSVKFSQAGQYDYCVNGYNDVYDVHGIVTVQ